MFVAETERSECFRYTTIVAYALAYRNGLLLLLSCHLEQNPFAVSRSHDRFT